MDKTKKNNQKLFCPLYLLIDLHITNHEDIDHPTKNDRRCID